MKGKHHIIVETRRLRYEFDIRRNITIIQGDSATGKTTLLSLLQEYGIRGEASGIQISSDVPTRVYSGATDGWKATLGGVHSSIIFIDEGYDFIFSKDFAELVNGADNYYVLVTRKPLRNLPYSINEVFGIRTTGRYHFPEKVFHEFYPLYGEMSVIDDPDRRMIILTEDEKSGYQFFSNATGNRCLSAGGNSKIYEAMCVHDKMPDQTVKIKKE